MQDYYHCSNGEYLESKTGSTYTGAVCKQGDAESLYIFRNTEVAHTNLYTVLEYTGIIDFTVMVTGDYQYFYVINGANLIAHKVPTQGRWKDVKMWPGPTTDGLNTSHPYVDIELNLKGYNAEQEEKEIVLWIHQIMPSEVFITLAKPDSSEIFSITTLGLDYYEQTIYEVPHDAFQGEYVDIALDVDGHLVMPDNHCSIYSFACVYPNRTENVYNWTENEEGFFDDMLEITDERFAILY